MKTLGNFHDTVLPLHLPYSSFKNRYQDTERIQLCGELILECLSTFRLICICVRLSVVRIRSRALIWFKVVLNDVLSRLAVCFEYNFEISSRFFLYIFTLTLFPYQVLKDTYTVNWMVTKTVYSVALWTVTIRWKIKCPSILRKTRSTNTRHNLNDVPSNVWINMWTSFQICWRQSNPF